MGSRSARFENEVVYAWNAPFATRALGNDSFNHDCYWRRNVDAAIRPLAVYLFIHCHTHRYDYVYRRKPLSGVDCGSNKN